MTQTKNITARAKAFSTEGVGTYRFQIETDGTIRVYDSVAGHYTLCSSLSPSARKRLIQLANAA
jgi:hypothetical protein